MTLLYLVRHAHADYDPDEDRPLSERGRRDAARVADVLGGRPISAVYASPARRARDTVGPLATRLGLEMRVVADLRERVLAGSPLPPGEFEAAVQATWDDPTFAHPGGEPNVAAQRRGVAAIRQILAVHPDDRVVAATHGNLLALIVHHFDPARGHRFWQGLTMPDVYRLELEGDRLTALARVWRD